jgi:ligand-binding sensor domain-containing protein
MDPSGRLWAGTLNGIIRVSADGLIDTLATAAYNAEKHDVRSLVARRDGSVWVAIGDGQILSFAKDASSASRITTGDRKLLPETNALYETDDGVVFGGCRDGLLWRAVTRNGRATIAPLNHDFTSISFIMSTPDKQLWVTSDSDGVMRLDLAAPDHRAVITRSNGLLTNAVHRVMRDAEGNLWFAQSGGASRLRANYLAFANYPASTPAGRALLLPEASTA